MGDDASSNIAGASAFSDKEGDQTIRFIDSDYNTLFTLPNGANIILTTFRGRSRVLPCQYIDDTHTLIGTSVFHIHQFAMVQEQLGAAYRPEHPKRTDICDMYEIYQLKYVWDSEYGFCSYDAAREKLHPSHYKKVYAGVLAPGVTLGDLFFKHNAETRPRKKEMRSMSVSDIVVVNRNSSKKAYYRNNFGFQEAAQFLKLQQQKKKRSGPER